MYTFLNERQTTLRCLFYTGALGNDLQAGSGGSDIGGFGWHLREWDCTQPQANGQDHTGR